MAVLGLGELFDVHHVLRARLTALSVLGSVRIILFESSRRSRNVSSKRSQDAAAPASADAG